MATRPQGLRSWRELLAGPPRKPESETVPTVSTTADVLPRQRLVRTGPNTWAEAEWARGLCVFCDQPTADGDVISCAEHRAKMDAIVMPREEVGAL